MIFGITCRFRSETTLPQQKFAMQAYLKAKGLKPIDIWLPIPSYPPPAESFREGKDPILLSLAPGDTALCLDFHYLGRYRSDAILRLAALLQAGVNVVAARPDENTADLQNPQAVRALRIALLIFSRIPRSATDGLKDPADTPAVKALAIHHDAIVEARRNGANMRRIADNLGLTYYHLRLYIKRYVEPNTPIRPARPRAATANAAPSPGENPQLPRWDNPAKIANAPNSRAAKAARNAAAIQLAVGEPCVPEFRFHPTRRWRFDYAFPARRVAIEVEGGVWSYGRHNRPKGFINDMEKYNAATALGWRVFRCTPQQLLQEDFLQTVAAACKDANDGPATAASTPEPSNANPEPSSSSEPTHGSSDGNR